jgi:hypothetical protein
MVGGDRYYAVHSPRRFTELQRMGTRWLRYDVEATVYPELLRIREMLVINHPYAPATAAEWGRYDALALAM